MSPNIILITPDDLSRLLKEAVRAELQTMVSELHALQTDEVLNSDSVMDLLKISPSYLIKLRGKGLPHYWLDNGVVRYKKSEVLAFMQGSKKNRK